MIAAAGTANSKVLLHPTTSPAVVESSNRVAIDVHDFHELLGIESGRLSSEATRWRDAASESWDKARETGAGSIKTVRQFGNETRSHAKLVREKLSDRVAERKSRRREDDGEREE